MQLSCFPRFFFVAVTIFQTFLVFGDLDHCEEGGTGISQDFLQFGLSEYFSHNEVGVSRRETPEVKGYSYSITSRVHVTNMIHH